MPESIEKESTAMTVVEVAERFGVHPTTVQNWIRQGHLPNAYKLGPGRNSPYRVPTKDVDELAKQLKRPA